MSSYDALKFYRATHGRLVVFLLFVNLVLCALDINGEYFGTTSLDSAQDIVLDSESGSAYVTGYTNGSFSTFANYGVQDIVVMKLDVDTMIPAWTLQYGSSDTDQGSGIAYQSATQLLYVTGYTQGALPDLAPAPVIVCGFLLQMNASNGEILWSRRVGNNNTQPFKVAVDSSNGIIYVVGVTNEKLVVSNLGYDSFLMKFDPNGTRIWTAQLSYARDEIFASIAVDPNSDAIYIGGRSNTPNVGAYSNFQVGLFPQPDLLVFKLSKNNGSILWVNGTGSVGSDGAVGLSLSPSGTSLVATGYAGGPILGYYSFLGSLDSVTILFDTTSGYWKWISTDGTNVDDAGQAVVMDSSTIYVVGYTDGSLYGNPTIGLRDATLVTYDLLGYRQNSYQFGSTGFEYVSGVTGSLQSLLLVCGNSNGDLYGSLPQGSSDMTVMTLLVPSPSPTMTPGASPSATPSITPISSVTPTTTPSPDLSPSATPTHADHSSNGTSRALVGAVIGTLGGALLVAGVAGFAFWRLKRNQKKQSEFSPASVEMHPANESQGSVLERRSTLIAEEHRKYVIKYPEIVLGDQLGAGAFGVVYKGIWRAQQVAVKKVKEDMIGPDTGTEFKDFLMEAIVMMRLKPHKNITTLYAVCLSPLCIVTEFVENGSLEKYLLKKSFTMTELINFLRDISAGMSHLAAEGVVHKDLAARNVLVTASGSCKIADFGLARNYQEKHYSSSAIGPLRWMSPENLLKKEFSEKSDVWSFAATAVEIFTKKIPYAAVDTIVVTREVMNGTLKPKLPTEVDIKDGVSQVPTKLLELIAQCASYEPAPRPTFAEIVNVLSAVLGVQPEESTVYHATSTSAPQIYNTISNFDQSKNNSNDNSTSKTGKGSEYNTTNSVNQQQQSQELYNTNNRSNTYGQM